jgi:diaminopimelate decarboxylase
VAGRYCESGDVLLRDLPLPPAAPGDTLAVATAGAYTLSMASTYNMVPRPAVVLVSGGVARLIQRRETEDELLARDLLL